MQSMSKSSDPSKPKGVFSTFNYIYKENGIKGLYRGVGPRISLGIWQSTFMIFLSDIVRDALKI